MKHLRADIVKEFSCLGGSCPNTCCKGWRVYIDDATYRKYQAFDEPLRSEMLSKIEKVGDSYALNKDGLCDVYIKISPDAMGEVCQMFPRDRTDVGDMRLYYLHLSCPEVVRLLIDRKDNVSYLYEEDDVPVKHEAFEPELLNVLFDGFVLSDAIAVNESLSIGEKLYTLFLLSKLIQEGIDNKNPSLNAEQIGLMENEDNLKELLKLCPDSLKTECISYENAKMFLGGLSNVRENLYIEDILKRMEACDKTEWDSRAAQLKRLGLERELGNIFSYVMFEYFMTAIKDGDIMDKFFRASLVMRFIQIYMVLFLAGERENLKERLCDGVSRISRDIEHSSILEKVVGKVHSLELIM